MLLSSLQIAADLARLSMRPVAGGKLNVAEPPRSAGPQPMAADADKTRPIISSDFGAAAKAAAVSAKPSAAAVADPFERLERAREAAAAAAMRSDEAAGSTVSFRELQRQMELMPVAAAAGSGGGPAPAALDLKGEAAPMLPQGSSAKPEAAKPQWSRDAVAYVAETEVIESDFSISEDTHSQCGESAMHSARGSTVSKGESSLRDTYAMSSDTPRHSVPFASGEAHDPPSPSDSDRRRYDAAPSTDLGGSDARLSRAPPGLPPAPLADARTSITSACGACGDALIDGKRFCAGCGTAVPQKVACGACGDALIDGKRFCAGCGTAVPQTVRSTPRSPRCLRAVTATSHVPRARHAEICGGAAKGTYYLLVPSIDAAMLKTSGASRRCRRAGKPSLSCALLSLRCRLLCAVLLAAAHGRRPLSMLRRIRSGMVSGAGEHEAECR